MTKEDVVAQRDFLDYNINLSSRLYRHQLYLTFPLRPRFHQNSTQVAKVYCFSSKFAFTWNFDVFLIFSFDHNRKYLNSSRLKYFFMISPSQSLLDFSETFYSVLVFTGVGISAEYKLREGVKKGRKYLFPLSGIPSKTSLPFWSF